MPYIGVSPFNGVRRKHTYTATASQTSFSGAGTEGITLSYKDSTFVDVYQNGVKLGEADYTSTSGTAIVLAQGASVNDIIEIVVYDVFSVADTVSKADGGTFDGNVAMAGTLGVTGVLTGTSLDISGDIDVDGTTNLDVVDIDGAVDMATTLLVAGNVDFNGDLDVDGTTNLDVVDIDGAVDMASSLTVAGNLSVDGGTIKLDGNYPTAAGNSALGDDALGSASLSGGYNTAIGDHAMQANTSGNNNTAIGHQALYNNTTGTLNSGLGLNSMFSNTSGTQSQAIGYRSMFAHTTGTGNTAVGLESANSITTGSFNTMVGRYTADILTTGSYNTHIGNDTDVSGATVEFTIAIGHGAVDKGTNTGMINANSGVYQGNNSSAWSTVSDKRIKKNIVDNNDGLNAINQVQVRNFEYRTEDEITDFDNPKSAVVNKQGVQLGVIAQEIQAVLPDMVKEETTGVISVNPENMTWHLVNAVKELSAKNDELERRLAKLEGK